MTARLTIVAKLITACMLVIPGIGVHAQAHAPLALPELPGNAASAAAPVASAPAGPRLRSAVEAAHQATAPGDLRPERPVAPQITIPFGKKPPPAPKRADRPATRGSPATTGSVDDAAARCESQTDAQERAVCRAKLARETRAKLPN